MANGVNRVDGGNNNVVFGKLHISSDTLQKLRTKVLVNKISNHLSSQNTLFPEYRANEQALNKLSQAERKEYEELFHYTNSKSHGMDPMKDAKIAEWNATHPDCLIKSQYDDDKFDLKS